MATAANVLHRSLASSLQHSPFAPRTNSIATALPLSGVVGSSAKLRGRKVLESPIKRLRVSPEKSSIVPADDDDDGVSLGTLKLPSNTNIPLFETLLFQWANSLCQGANLPLPVPLKVDKVEGGARLGFISVEDGKTEICAYIDCLVFPATAGSGPIFRAIRHGPMKDQSPPGEPRIMRSLLQALKTSLEIARL